MQHGCSLTRKPITSMCNEVEVDLQKTNGLLYGENHRDNFTYLFCRKCMFTY